MGRSVVRKGDLLTDFFFALETDNSHVLSPAFLSLFTISTVEATEQRREIEAHTLATVGFSREALITLGHQGFF